MKVQLTIVASALLLVGCSTTGKSPPSKAAAAATPLVVTATATATATDTPTPAASITPEAAYLTFMNERWPATIGDDGPVLAAGHSTCTALDNNTVTDVVLAASRSSATAQDSGIVIAGAVRYLCPQYVNEVSAWVAAHPNGVQ